MSFTSTAADPGVTDLRVTERRARETLLMEVRMRCEGVLVVCGLVTLATISDADLLWRFTQQCITVILFCVRVPEAQI